jgi:phosphoribosyl-dephospho-CoA transferase
MPPLHRHQLAQLTAEGWSQALAQSGDPAMERCILLWSQRRFPLVVTQQPEGAFRRGRIALGLPAPLDRDRRRIRLDVCADAIGWLDEFPPAVDALPLLPRRARAHLEPLLDKLIALGTPARVYGSHGWQLLTGLDYLHRRSDLDLWIAVDDAADADAAAACLASARVDRPRIDGELVFTDGTATAWREWAAWRAGRTSGLLVKRLHGASIEHRGAFGLTSLVAAA